MCVCLFAKSILHIYTPTPSKHPQEYVYILFIDFVFLLIVIFTWRVLVCIFVHICVQIGGLW